MSEAKDLQDMARALREHAGETNMSEYVRLMLRAAQDLEALATGQDHPVSQETAHPVSGK